MTRIVETFGEAVAVIVDLLLENFHTLIVLVGFVAMEIGIALAWSGAGAAIVGGVILMLGGSWRYVAPSLWRRT
jgi:hypothetical protein